MQGYRPQPQGITCPQCGAHTVAISMVQSSASTRTRGRGCLWQIGRACLIICTLGLWLLIGKSKGKSKTHIHSDKMAVCQRCGHSWRV